MVLRASYDFYDLDGDGAVAMLTARDEQGHGYYPVVEDSEVVGFLCFGPDARVLGQREDPSACDVGAGLRPDRVSRGLAAGLMPAAMAFARDLFGEKRLRAAVAAFNERSLRLCASAGFKQVREFDGPRGQTFVELILDVHE